MDKLQREAVEKAIGALADLMDSVLASHPGLEKVDYSKSIADNIGVTRVDERHVKAMLNGKNAWNKLRRLPS
ncbi:MAG: hypothetical protein IPK26_15985 [Planctomycetes bacterium]|nr:hypothetical protein [Planctomycetota bacterium]